MFYAFALFYTRGVIPVLYIYLRGPPLHREHRAGWA